MSKTQILIFIIIVLLLANIAMVVSFASKKGAEKDTVRKREPNQFHVVLKNQVGFTPEQMEKMESMKKQHWGEMKVLFEDVRKAKLEFYDYIDEEKVTEAQLQESARKIGDKQEAIDMQAFRNFREIRSLCTPEQLPLYDSLIPGVIKKIWFSPRRGKDRKGDAHASAPRNFSDDRK